MQSLPHLSSLTSGRLDIRNPHQADRPNHQTQRLASLRARVQSQRQEQKSQGDCSPSYPEYEETTAQDGLLPKRQPGQFPAVKSDSLGQRLRKLPVAGQVVDSLMGTNVALEEGAVFDPLRDGPLRYLGYANECG